MIRRLWPLLLIPMLIAPAVAEPAAGGLRGPATAFHKPVPPTKPKAALRPPDEALASPGLARPVAPRLKGWTASTVGGGSQCRTACSRDQYTCLAQDGGDCTVQWSKCVAACPETSAGPL